MTAVPADPLAAYERLVKLIELELELADQGRTADLQVAVLARSAYLHALPRPVPPEARGLLLRAQALHGRVTIETRRLGGALEQRRRTRQIARLMARTYVRPPRRHRYSASA